MEVKLLEVKTKSEVKSRISLVSASKSNLPTIIDGWRFNFSKHSKRKGFETYVLSTYASPERIEGCLIIDIARPNDVYMAFVEIAPHNQGSGKQYDRVAGCLIAFACRQSFVRGKEGYLAFDVVEQSEEDELRLMSLYSRKYKALRFGQTTTMIIVPEASEQLISEYLG